jgi:hypothetical protein
MKGLFILGIILIIAGVLSLVVPIPHTEHEGIKAGGISMGVETHHSQTVAPIVSAVLILGGVGMVLAAKFKG